MSDIPEYRDRVNTDILRLIPPDSESILEIGCGSGKLFEAYRRINPSVMWYAIEKDTEARVAAYKSGVKIIGDDAEVCFADGVEPWREDIDCLVIGDCLEHFRDPWTVLKNAAHCIKPGGQVIASIPNVQNYSLIVSLLQGRWDYKDEGLLDRGHLRWFTLYSIRKMFADAGLQIFDVRGRCFGTEHHQEFMERIKAFGGWHGIDLAELDKQSRVLQYVVRALKPE